MPRYDLTCPNGHEQEVWRSVANRRDPCPTCGAPVELLWKQATIRGDDVPGGFWAENGFDTPQKFYSHSAHEQALAARGREIRAKWAGPMDKILKRWDVPCAQTLENARILVSRGNLRVGSSDDDPVAVPDQPITGRAVRLPMPRGFMGS